MLSFSSTCISGQVRREVYCSASIRPETVYRNTERNLNAVRNPKLSEGELLP